jgi:TorA maturation chaperone TorD
MPSSIDSNAIGKANFRSNVYGILALSFSPPESEPKNLYTAILDAGTFLRSTEDNAGPDVNFPEDTAFADLGREHLRLFVGPGHIQCPPYEAVYRKDRPIMERGLVMGPSTTDVRRRYAESNLGLSKKFTDLPDHIAAEMEFMHFLCAEESRFTEQGNSQESAKMRKIEKEFLNDHLKPWVYDFADCVLRSANSSFYKAAASLLKTFIESESENILGSGTQ